MKNLFLLMLIFCSFKTWATNGVNLSSSTVRGMGVAGNGISHLYSPGDALLKNPATLGSGKKEFEVGLLNLHPNVRSRDKSQDSSYRSSKVNLVPIPTAAYTSKAYQFDYAFGFIPMAGLASDFKNETSIYELAPELSVVTIPLGISRRIHKTKVGLSVFSALGAAAINTSKVPGESSQSTRNPNLSYSYGYVLGLHQELNPQWETGIAYKSSTRFTFKKQTDLESYVGVTDTGLDNITLELPSELGLGITHSNDIGTISLEGKRIFWSQSEGFSDYDWKDQDVLAISWLKKFKVFGLSAGYSYSTQVFSSKTNEDGTKARRIENANLTQQNVSYFNVIGYPAILRHHYSLGLNYDLSKEYQLNSSLLYCPPEQIERSGQGGIGTYNYQTRISLTFINIGITKTW